MFVHSVRLHVEFLVVYSSRLVVEFKYNLSLYSIHIHSTWIYLLFVVLGHLITVDSAFLYDQEQAVLVSPVMDQHDWSCARLVYQITGRGSLQLHLRPDGDNFDYRLWTASKASDSWLIASVDLPNTTIPYQVGLAVKTIVIRSWFLKWSHFQPWPNMLHFKVLSNYIGSSPSRLCTT